MKHFLSKFIPMYFTEWKMATYRDPVSGEYRPFKKTYKYRLFRGEKTLVRSELSYPERPLDFEEILDVYSEKPPWSKNDR